MDIYDNSSEISSIAKASPMIMFLIGMPSKRLVYISGAQCGQRRYFVQFVKDIQKYL